MQKNYQLKERAIVLRKKGTSMIAIESQLGIARSTLSGWLRNVHLTPIQKQQLIQNSAQGLAKARLNAIESKRLQKLDRLQTAENEARQTLAKLTNSPSVLELALAMLYWGEGSKGGYMSMGNSDAQVLKFFISAVSQCYSLPLSKVRFDLHLRADQDANNLRLYWTETLGLSDNSFRSITFDKRTVGSPTHSYYKGVCQVYFGNIALQRRLFFVYTHYCTQVVHRVDP